MIFQRPLFTKLGLLLCCLVLGGCKEDNSKKEIEQALNALKERETQILSREVAAQKHEKDLVERETQLKEATSQLHHQQAEIDVLKVKWESEFAKLKEIEDAIALREKRGAAPAVTAQRVLIIDPKTGDILYEKSADLRGQVASTQKLLTALIIVEDGDLDKIVTVEQKDTECAPVRFGLKAGEQYSRRQLLTALMVKSSNDISQALARDNAGSMEAFVQKMNEKAKQLGLKNSHFANPSGLPDSSQYSTARDMAIIAKAADTWPVIREMVSTKNFDFKKNDNSIVPMQNTNRVLRSYAACDGMKTGFTQAAGYCLISSGEIDGRRRIVVVLNGTSRAVWRDSQALLEWSLKG